MRKASRRKASRGRTAGPVLVCFLAHASCTGTIGDSPSDEDRGQANGGGPSGAGGSVTPPPKGLESPDTGLWRLTRTEYTNTLRDLLGDTTQAGKALEANSDNTLEGTFDKNAAHLASVKPLIDQYDTISANALDGVLNSSASRAKLLAGCDPVRVACARTVVASFARRAWRRPVGDEEVKLLWDGGALPLATAQGAGPEEAVKLAFRMAMVSPRFLYRVESEPPGARGLYPVSPHELATRLSYFLWSSMPDDDLFKAADAPGDRNLAKPSILAAQIARMLGDGKSSALLDDFAAQWLTTRNLAFVTPDKRVPGQSAWSDSLRQPMLQEGLRFFGAFLEGDRNVVDMLDTDFTFVNDALAKFYQLPLPGSNGMRQVSSAPATSHRFGLLSQAGILTVTANADHTNIPKRAKWVLTNLLCTPPGNPPKVPATLDQAVKDNGGRDPKTLSVREKWNAVEENPKCGSCHKPLNPIGFALEEYNAVGLWRSRYSSGALVDAKGVLPDGTMVDGAQELARTLKNDPRFVACFTRKVFAFALGRTPDGPGDDEAIKALAVGLTSHGGRIRELITQIASSAAFQLRGGARW